MATILAKVKASGPAKSIYAGRRRRGRARKMRLPIMASSGFPKVQTVRMRYCDHKQLTATSGVVVGATIAANDIFDPDFSLGGHQPMGRDEWAQFYNHYQVVSSKIKCTIINKTTGNIPMACGIYLADDTVVYNQYTAYREGGRGTHKILNTGNDSQVTVKSSFNAKRFFGAKDDAEQQALVTASPAEKAFYIAYAQPVDELTTSSEVIFVFDVEYTVKFFEPKDLNPS